MIWFTLILFAASVLLGELLRPKPNLKNAQPAGLGDFQFPTATEARRIPLVWGTVEIRGPNVVWYGDLLQDPIRERVKTGLFSSETFTKGFRYYIGMQFALCEGPVDSLRTMRIQDKLVLDATASPITHGGTFTVNDPELFGGDDLGSGGFIGTFEFFAGTAAQSPSSYLANHISLDGGTPAYRHTCYVAPYQEHIYVGNSTSIEAPRYEVTRIAATGANPLGLATPAVNTLDANPANVLYEVCTNMEWGAKIATTAMDADSFEDAAAVLATEGNGFSFLLDAEEDLGAMVKRLEKQIDGAVVQDAATGLWKLQLVRDDYAPEDAQLFTDGSDGEPANIDTVETFTRGTWEGTANVVSVEFVDRSDEYKTTFATAANDANVEVQEGNRVFAGDRYPGVKDGTLADSIAWRDLRVLSTPLAQARVVTNRTTYAVNPYDPVRLTFTGREFAVVGLPMRVKSVDRGSLIDGRIIYELVEDVFRAGAGSYGPPPPSEWEPPVIELEPYPADEQLAMEAPRALCARNPLGIGATDDVIFAAARRQGGEAAFAVAVRHASGSPSGAFAAHGTVYGFCRIGELAGTLAVGTAVPTGTITIASDPDSQATLLASLPAFAAAPSPTAVGTDLLGLIYVGGEFMLVRYASVGSGSNVDLRDVYRGALDSVQTVHAAGEEVFLVFLGAGMTSQAIPPTNNVEVKLLPRSLSGTLATGDATTISFAMANRTRRPYAPSELSLNGTRFATSTSLEGGGSGELDGIVLAFRRRDFRTQNEVASLEADAGTLAADFPAANATEHEVEIIDDPDGAATSILTYDLGSGAYAEIPRLEILRASGGVVPTRLEFRLRAGHSFEGAALASRVDLRWAFNLTSGLTGDFAFGALDTTDVSDIYTADAAGTHGFSLSSAFTAGDVEYRLNGGGFSTLIVAGATTGSVAGVTVGDTLEVRHASTDTGALKLLTMNAPGAGTDGFAVLYV